MKDIGILLLGLLVFQTSWGQSKICGCPDDKSIIESPANCKIVSLQNGSKLYYQFNCDSVWLTLENNKGLKKIIYSMTGEMFRELYGINYRIGYQLAKEYNKYLLFRTGCPANGRCNFVVINKLNGKKVLELGELIYDHSTNKFYPFVIYFANHDNPRQIVIHYLDTAKKYVFSVSSISIEGNFPEYEFDEVSVKNNRLILRKNKKVIAINILKYHS
ncbi:hypothetical protein EOD41_11235 [Mucilaginibacter limnophilus]|uniref:Uncharacterized protein n=1 Tax=Mucilaginibacter limnophilus TaxID=1932778 RepID=A0A437MSE2_9SPHI|nr:hypothetical protein [Mucilaginibacter limnophilus]RVU00569.1 hypothetical protein EOD41_11235 [Mucilaginibacter limnophilus]